MKRILGLILILTMAWCGSAFAAAASCTTTEYGYYITGGYDTTLVPQDTWAPGTYYNSGSHVSTAGTIYEANYASTSSTAFITDYNKNMWTKKGYSTILLYGAIFSPAAATDTVTFTSLGATDSTAMMPAFTMNQNQESVLLGHPQTFGTPFRKLTIKMSSATDAVYLYVYSDNFSQN